MRYIVFAALAPVAIPLMIAVGVGVSVLMVSAAVFTRLVTGDKHAVDD